MNEQEQIDRLMAIIEDFTNEIRAHSAPECDDEENPFAPILRRADEAISEFYDETEEFNLEDFPNAAEYLKAVNPRIVTNRKKKS